MQFVVYQYKWAKANTVCLSMYNATSLTSLKHQEGVWLLLWLKRIIISNKVNRHLFPTSGFQFSSFVPVCCVCMNIFL